MFPFCSLFTWRQNIWNTACKTSIFFFFFTTYPSLTLQKWPVQSLEVLHRGRILSHGYSSAGLIWGFNSSNFLCLTILLCHSAWWGELQLDKPFFLVLLQKAMIQKLPGAVIFLLTPVLQSSSRNSANIFEFLQRCFQCQSSEAEFSPSVACENLYVPSLTLCSESIQQHQDTISLQHEPKRAGVKH